MDTEVLEFFSRDMVDGDGLTPEIGLASTAKSVDLPEVDMVDLDVFDEEEVVEFPPGQRFEVVANKTNKKRSSQSCVEEASVLIEAQHQQLKNLLERQHKEHMDALKGIHDTLKALLEAMTGKI
ncbi:uncharacterized protein LOC118747005 [Rhagoletis pomonella]|uniref:uncharacterized protein LOC118747005 n=1 Tax=Rhagoletis pomonella TaxID=28610 RepID=UPI00177E92AF|nr:uncharacterized protein LOC118747005 [Rhagoletis pomonella]